MTEQEAFECAALDLAWMEAEEWADDFMNLAAGTTQLATNDVDLIRKACSIVGLECKRRQRERQGAPEPE